MKLFGKILILMTVLCLRASTAAAVPQPEPPSLVTQIQVSYHYGDMHIRRRYTNTDKIDVILYYLYDLLPGGTPQEDPEQIWGDCCQIVLTESNGGSHVYRQQGGRFLSVDNHPWQTVSQRKTAVLFPLLLNMESDL